MMNSSGDGTRGSFYLQVPPPVAVSSSMNKSLPSLPLAQSPSSVKSNLDHSPMFLGGMATIVDYDSTNVVCKDNRIRESVPHHHHCETSYRDLQEKAEFEKRRAENLALQLKKIESELEDLTLSLFTEANRLVEKERRTRVEMELQLEQASSQPDDHPSCKGSILLGSTLQMAEFELFYKQLQDQPFHKLHKLPYMKVCLRLDIIPCLKMNQDEGWIKKWLYALLHYPCYIEDRAKSKTWQASEFQTICVGCHKPMSSLSAFRFRWNPQDPWQWMGQQCRNRSVAVCNFYSFLRHINQRLVTTRSLSSLYKETIHLRLEMHATKMESK